jgi:hypothetical protein
MNPVQNVFCNNCGERLVSFPAEDAAAEAQPTIKGLSLPTKGAAEESEEPEPDAGPDDRDELDKDTPAWLRDLQASLQGEAEDQGPDTGQDDAEVPDWLRDLEAPLPDAPEPAGPPPKTERSAEPHEPVDVIDETDLEEEADLPGWLADFQEDAPGEELGEGAREAEDVPEEPEPFEEPAPIESETEGDRLPGAPEEESPVLEAIPEESPGDHGAEAVPEGMDEVPVPPPVEPDVVEPEPAVEAEPAATDEAPAFEEETPDWLADLEDLPSEEDATDEPEETPDWLVDLYAEAPPGAEPPDLEDAPPAGAEETPSAEIEPEEVAKPEAEPEVSAGVEVEPGAGEVPEEAPQKPSGEIEPEEAAGPEAGLVPDWLDELEPEGMDESLELEAGAGGEDFSDLTEDEIKASEVPDWLSELEPGAMDESLEFEDDLVAGVDEDISVPEWVEPDDAAGWMAALSQAEDEDEDWPPPEAEEAAATEEEEPDETVSDWLDETPDEEENLDRAAEIALAATVPAWLADLPPDREEEALLAGEDDLVDGEIPDWLVADEAELDEVALERADIPDWLMQLKPQEVRQAEGEEIGAPAEAAGEIEETGILAGIPGVLPIEMAIAQPRVAVPAGAELLPAESAESRLFAEIVSQPVSIAAQTIERPGRRLLDQVPRWIIYAILIAVVVLPLVVDTSLLTRTFPTDPAGEAPYYAPVADLHAAIDGIADDAAVLVAFDYDPATSSEMDMVTRPVLDHLMARQVPIVALSLLPAGPQTAQELLDEVAATHSGYTYGQNYVNLGYIPGQASAVRRLALPDGLASTHDFAGTEVDQLPLLQSTTGLADVALIIELAPTQDSVRWWIEQAGTATDVRIGAAVSASAEPLIRPYYETEPRQLEGIVGGVTGTALYEVLRSDSATPTETTTSRLNAQLLGTILFAVVLVGGNVVYFAQRGLGRDR